MSNETLTKEVIVEMDRIGRELFSIVEGLVNGGGDVAGMGETTTNTLSMTDATETLYGSSGRGSQIAVKKFEAAARMGFVFVFGNKKRRVGITEKGLEFYREMKNVLGDK